MNQDPTIEDFEGNLMVGLVQCPENFPINLKPHHFERSVHRDIFTTMTRLKSQGKSWDLPILYAEGNSDEKRWLGAFNTLWYSHPHLISVYADRLRNSYRQRISADVMKEVETDLGFVEPFEFQSRLGRKLAEEETENQTVSMKQAGSQLCAHLEKANLEGGVSGITTGFSGLDKYFNGFQPSRLYILAARPSMGKSALMLNFAVNAAKADFTIYTHCLEESILSITTRALSRETGIDNESLQRGRIAKHEWIKVFDGVSQLSELRFFLNEQTNIGPEQLCNSVRAQNLKTPIDMVFIDHIQEIQKKRESWHHDISEAAGMFKALAKDLKIPVLVVSQLSRSVEQSTDKRPLLSHLKESGDIEAKADVVLLLFREVYYKPETADKSLAELSIAKNRDGRVGTFHLHWNPSEMKFGERLVG